MSIPTHPDQTIKPPKDKVLITENGIEAGADTPAIPPPPETPDVPVTDTSNDDTAILLRAMDEYRAMGLSVMWGRAEEEIINGKLFYAKSPIEEWSKAKEHGGEFTRDELANQLINPRTHVRRIPMIICGKASGNLVVIDIDTKHWPDIARLYFTALKDADPELWGKLRMHGTPSGGFHLLYRTEEFVADRNRKLAYKADVGEAGIETREHGGCVGAPPGSAPDMGYSIVRDVPIPTIGVEDHNLIIAIAKMFDERVKPKTFHKPTKAQQEEYDESPFKHFNRSPAGEEILAKHGWPLYREGSKYKYSTRPGKEGGVSVSFNKDTRCFWVFTTSTELEGGRGYDASAVRCMLECGGDYKKLFSILVSEGYGTRKPQDEDKLITNSVSSGKPLPQNISDEGKETYELLIAQRNEKYPYGIYWRLNPKTGAYSIQRELLCRFLFSLGVRIFRGEPCIIEGRFVRKLKENKKKPGESELYDLIKSWIREDEEYVYLAIAHELNKFWQNSGEFIVSKLQMLDNSQLLKSSPKICYKLFKNGIVEITSNGKRGMQYDDDSVGAGLIWVDEVIQCEWRYIDREAQEKTIFPNFIRKAISGDPVYVDLVLGYLCCGYKLSSEAYLIAFMESSETSLGGGTGKNFCFDMLKYFTSVLTTNGQSVKRDVDQLIQNWNGEKLVHLSDLPKWVNLSDLKHIISDDSQRKMLYKDIQNIDKADMPKFVVSGQFGINTHDDGGVNRRVRQLAFSGYFHGDGSIRREYGGDVPEVFKECDWDGYYSYLIDCVVAYMKVRKLELVENIGLWLKGWDMRFSGGESYLRDAIEEKIPDWAKNSYTTNAQVWEWYEVLCKGGVGPREKIKGIKKVHDAIKEYGKVTDLFEYDTGSREYIDGHQQRVVKVKMRGMAERNGSLEGNNPF